MILRLILVFAISLFGFGVSTSLNAQNVLDYNLLKIKNTPKFTEWSVKYNEQLLAKGNYKAEDTTSAQNYTVLFRINSKGNLVDSLKIYKFGILSVTGTFKNGRLKEHKLFRRSNGSLKQLIVSEGETYRRYLYSAGGVLYEERLETSGRKVLYKKTREKISDTSGLIETETDYQNNKVRVILENGEVVSEYCIDEENDKKHPITSVGSDE